MSDYFVFIHRPGPAWRAGVPIFEQPLDGHFAYMTELEDAGVLLIGGGFPDGAGALGVIQANSLEEATSVVSMDPAVLEGVVTTEVHPFMVTVGGTVHRSGG